MPGACRCGSNEMTLVFSLQHRVGVQLLILGHALDVDVDAVAETEHGPLVLRLVALRCQLVAELEVRGHVLAARVRVQRVGHNPRTLLQEHR